MFSKDRSLRHLENENNELLLDFGMCDGLHDSLPGGSKAYLTYLPKHVLVQLLMHSVLLGVVTWILVLAPGTFDTEKVPREIRQQRGNSLFALFGFFLLIGLTGMWFFVVLMQIPKQVIREADSFVLRFWLYNKKVPLDDIDELLVLNTGAQFQGLMQRWKVFPHGHSFRIFCGARSAQDAVCVVLTRRLFSYVFCLEDPTQFLLDNQRPLELNARFRTTCKAVFRTGESADSENLGAIPRGTLVRVEEQRGRRVLIKVDGEDIRGWISYISTKGVTLLTKERQGDATFTGVIGASQFTRSEKIGGDVEFADIHRSGARHGDARE